MAERIGINEIIRAVAKTNMLTLQESSNVVRQVFDIIRQTMIDGGSVHLQSFGIFRGVMKPAGMVMNPKTKMKNVYREEHMVPKMKFSYNMLRVDEKKTGTLPL
jgi:nucleoid DNA-binding protein